VSQSQRKEQLLLELKELLAIVLYLLASFSLLATGKSLILIQLGINNFVHAYVTALIESLALGKIVMLAQRIPVLDAAENKPLLGAAMFKSAVMTVIVFIGSVIEEKIFAPNIGHAPLKQELLIDIAHISALFVVFYVLFLARGLDRALGPGRLLRLLTEPHPNSPPQ
jgi:hypothetical protein